MVSEDGGLSDPKRKITILIVVDALFGYAIGFIIWFEIKEQDGTRPISP